jgi:acyl-CoA thioester hydrolase
MNRFTYEFPVPAEALDVFGHVNNIEYIRWIQDAARLHSDAVGYGWEEYQRLGAAFVIRKHVIDYLRPVLAGDSIAITTWIDSATRVSADRVTEIRNGAGEMTVSARTTWVWVTLATMRPGRIPQDVRDRFTRDN